MACPEFVYGREGMCERPETALFLLMQAVPCVLHMENRVSLKMLTMLLLVNGVSEVKKGSIFGHIIVKLILLRHI